MWHLQRIADSGVFEGHGQFNNLWDEYRFEAHEGPHEQLDHAWDSVIDPIVIDNLDRVPDPEKRLLFFGTNEGWEYGDERDNTEIAPINEELLADEIRRNLIRVAINTPHPAEEN
tara:strand:+ start:6753 stop:7097 length:345 start_codon:yes stop_codon:yes gene_type:complete